MADASTLPKKARSPATYADIEALPENMVGEILNGTLHASPRPAARHGVAAIELGYELVGPFRRGVGGPGGWTFATEPEVHLGSDVVVPDLAGWRRERLPNLPATPFVEVAPDWISENLSPSTQRVDRTDKLGIYAAAGVGHAWYVDPIVKTLEVMTLVGGKWQITATYKDDEPVTAPPFEAHSFQLDVLWPDDTNPEPQS